MKTLQEREAHGQELFYGGEQRLLAMLVAGWQKEGREITPELLRQAGCPEAYLSRLLAIAGQPDEEIQPA